MASGSGGGVQHANLACSALSLHPLAQDYTHNNIAHAFWSVKPADDDGALEALLRAFSLLAPDQLHAFSAARYERGHHIAPHDDRAYTPVRLDTGARRGLEWGQRGARSTAWRAVLLPAAADHHPACLPPACACAGEVVSCSRDLTVVYYLTKDWTEAMGGCLVDLEAEDPGQRGGSEGDQGRAREAAGGGAEQHPAQQKRGRVVVPQFNTAVFFRVPRYHSVTPLRTDRPRCGVGLGPGQGRPARACRPTMAECHASQTPLQVQRVWLVPAVGPAVRSVQGPGRGH